MNNSRSETVCPGCNMEIKDDVTMEDHGVCFDCHHEILFGHRCIACYEHGHIMDNCPLDVGE